VCVKWRLGQWHGTDMDGRNPTTLLQCYQLNLQSNKWTQDERLSLSQLWTFISLAETFDSASATGMWARTSFAVSRLSHENQTERKPETSHFASTPRLHTVCVVYYQALMCWRLMFSGILCYLAGWMFQNVSKDRSAYKTSGITRIAAHCFIQGSLYP
jgi:hypothetical protein